MSRLLVRRLQLLCSRNSCSEGREKLSDRYRPIKEQRKRLKELNQKLESASEDEAASLWSAKSEAEAAIRRALGGDGRRWVRRTGTPRGTLDLHRPEETAALERLQSVFAETAKSYGATRLETPVLHFDDVLLGGEEKKDVFHLQSFDGEDASLRFDLTVPFARFIAQHKIRADRRFQIGRAYRLENPSPSTGRFTEFVQADLDIAGPSHGMAAESEIIGFASEVLDRLDFKHTIQWSHRGLLESLLCWAGVEEIRGAAATIDKLDKIPWDKVAEELVSKRGLSCAVVEKLAPLFQHPIILDELRLHPAMGDPRAVAALEDVDALLGMDAEWGPRLRFDQRLARGLDYYTGLVFEFRLEGGGGSVGGGGRYDNLIGEFLKGHGVKAVGVSLGLSRLLTVLMADREPVQALCSMADNPGLLPQFGYCEANGIPWGLVFGAGELENGLVKLRDIPRKKDEFIQREDLLPRLRELFG